MNISLGPFQFIATGIRIFFSGLRRVIAWSGFAEVNLLQLSQLLVVPAVIAFGGLFLQQALRASAADAERNRAQENRIQEFIDDITTFLEKDFENAITRNLARSKTIATVDDMDGNRKGFIIRFVYELGLISGSDSVISLKNAGLEDIILDKAELFGANFNNADLSKANFKNARLTQAQLNGADLESANLTEALLVDARLNNANLLFAQLGGAQLSNASLFSANLSQADLNAANLSGALMNFARFSGATLRGATLIRSKMKESDLSGSDLRDADLRGAILEGANLKNAKMQGANLEGIIWTNATCPDGTKIEPESGTTCDNHLVLKDG